jgi:hypothetical protein
MAFILSSGIPASWLDNRACWFGTFNAIVYFTRYFYSVVYSSPYYLFEVCRGERVGEKIRTGLP